MKTSFITAAVASALAIGTSATPIIAPWGRINPTTISQYTVSTGAIDYNVEYGKVFKDGHASDITTLVTFDFPASLAGKTCTLQISLPSDATVTGSQEFDVFTSLMPADQTTSTWPSGNLRDTYLGRWTAVAGGLAIPGAEGIMTTTSFPCPAGYTIGGEMVGTGDVDTIEWDESAGGPFITYH